MITDHSQCLSLSLLAFSRRLASLIGGLWPRSLCLVRVPYISTRKSPSHSRASRLALSSSLSLSLGSLSSVALSFWSHVSLALLSRQPHLSRLVARLSLSLDVPLVSSLTHLSLPLRRGSARLQWRRQQLSRERLSAP